MFAERWSWDRLERENQFRFRDTPETHLLPKPLIFDIGFNSGEDSAAYLRAGYRVVAVEANANMVAAARDRSPFRDALVDGSLVLLNNALVEAHVEGHSVTFYVNSA